MKYLYYPDTLAYAGTVGDQAEVPYHLTVPPPANDDPDSVVVADPGRGTWVTRKASDAELDAARQVALSRIDDGYQKSLPAGFESSALGEPHTYRAWPDDINWLHQAVTISGLPMIADEWTVDFLCADEDGNWVQVPHTAAQIQQVGLDASIDIGQLGTLKAALTQQIMAATTRSQIAAVTWPD